MLDQPTGIATTDPWQRHTMKLYLISLAAGLLVGVVYSVLGVRSPAPPLIALVGLAGILVGEQIVPTLLQVWKGRDAVAFMRDHCAPHVLGSMPANCDKAQS
jgi:XapX domain-containing protein